MYNNESKIFKRCHIKKKSERERERVCMCVFVQVKDGNIIFINMKFNWNKTQPNSIETLNLLCMKCIIMNLFSHCTFTENVCTRARLAFYIYFGWNSFCVCTMELKVHEISHQPNDRLRLLNVSTLQHLQAVNVVKVEKNLEFLAEARSDNLFSYFEKKK